MDTPNPERSNIAPTKKPRRIDTYTLLGLLAWIGLVLICLAPAARAERIKDLAQVGGVRSNPLVGYGLVVGLDGTGNSAQSNRLQGSVTVTVIQRLPNGNLVVQGQKNMRLNQGDEMVQIQGIVRPADIGTDNTIASSKVADARIAFGGRGAIAQSNSMGWLGRFFNSPVFPN